MLLIVGRGGGLARKNLFSPFSVGFCPFCVSVPC